MSVKCGDCDYIEKVRKRKYKCSKSGEYITKRTLRECADFNKSEYIQKMLKKYGRG